MADIFDVIADPTRRDLLGRLLVADELSVGALVEQTGLSQPTVSKHLKVLRDQGLVQVREEAQHRYYRLDAAPLADVGGWLAPFLGELSADLALAGADGTPLIAWSGADAGEAIGRFAAEGAHRAQAALVRLEEATDRAKAVLADLQQRLPDALKRR